MARLHISEAWEQALEDRALTCESCNAPAEETGPHCLSCRLYWEDVRNGMFDRDFDTAPTEGVGETPHPEGGK